MNMVVAVCAGLCDNDKALGPFFLDGIMTGN